MAINQNRNSVRVLRTTSVGCLSHANIPNLSIGTGHDFTIQLWVVKGGDTDGILYGQEGGFSISLAGGVISFSLNGFAALTAGKDWALNPHCQDYIALRYRSGALALFVGGLQVAEKAVSATVPACTGDFFIGRQFDGGFSLIRVSSIARSDQEILSDNAVRPDVDSCCVFQSDCSTAQYKDVSSNHLPMWASGEGAGCGIYTACTVFSGVGQVSCTPLEALPAVHTLLLKLWPQDQQRRQQVYAAMDGPTALYTVELIPQSNHTFQLVLTSGTGGQAVMSTPLLPELWQDMAAVFEGGQVKLYLDGRLDGQYAFPFSGSRSDVLVGAEYESGKPDYEKGFYGYAAYTAEFGKALSAGDIALYADDPPFMFEDGLISLLPLDWPDEVESVGATALRTTGTAPFSLVSGITPRNGDIGVSLRLPTKISPDWEALSPEEQWTFDLLERLIAENMSALCGYPLSAGNSGGPVPLTRGAPRIVRRHKGKLYHELREMSPCPTPGDSRQIGVDLFARGSGRMSAAHGGGSTAASSATTAAAGGSAAAVQSHIGPALLTAAGMIAVAAITAAIAGAEEERPRGTGPLQVTGICWNHKGSPTQGGLHYHKGGSGLPDSMTDATGEVRLDTLCILVPSLLADPKVDVTISCSASSASPRSGTLNAVGLSGGGLLGNQSVPYTISPGETVTLTMPFSTEKLPKNGVYRLSHTWQFKDGDEFVTNCVCTIYLLPQCPIQPWKTNINNDYSTAEKDYLRTEFIDFFLPEGEQPKDFAQWAVQRLNSSGFAYDIMAGAPHYCDFYRLNLYLDQFLADAGKKNKTLNCADCAHIVSTACAMVGRALPMVRYVSGTGGQGFRCNRIMAIGYEEWRYPFEVVQEGASPRGGFSYHMFNADVTGSTPASVLVYDACLKVDAGEYPGDKGREAGTEKIPCLPTGMPAAETTEIKVNVPQNQAYKKNFYRERLVYHEAMCGFEPGFSYCVQGFLHNMAAVPVPANGYISAVMDAFSLSAASRDQERPSAQPAPVWTPKAIPGIVLTLEDRTGYDCWTLERLGETCHVQHWQCPSAEETALRLAATVASCAHPDKRSGEELGITVGVHRVIIAGSHIVFSQGRHIFAVGSGSLDVSRAVAEELDQSVLQGC